MVVYAPISAKPVANPLTGEEEVPIVQAGTTKRTTTGAISALPLGSAGTAASGISFITVGSASSALPNSRVLSATSPVLLTDGGAGGAIRVSLAFTPGTGTVTSVGLSGGTTGLTVSNSPITGNGTMTLGGILVVSAGGQGTSTLTARGVLIGNGTGAVAVTAAGSLNLPLVGRGIGADPAFFLLPAPGGGTGTTTIAANRVLVGDTVGSSITNIANATAGYVLTATGTASAPTFQAAASGAGTVTSVALAASALGLTVSGSPVTTNGTLTLSGFLNGTAIATASITDTQVATNTITFAKLQQVTGLSIVGITGTATANLAAITGTTRQALAVNTGGTALAFAQPRGDQLLGTNTNDAASAGNVGELISATVTTPGTAVVNATAKTIATILLTPGDWDVDGALYFTGATATTVSFLFAGSSLTTDTVDLTPGAFAELTYNNQTPFNVLAQVSTVVPTRRISASANTSTYMVALPGFAVSTCSAFGIIRGRRVR